jgi:prophage tail gpP-like protein
MLTLADYFELSGFAVFGDDVPINADDECIIDIEGEPVITGYIDEVKISTNGNLTLIGRDKTRDLVDCQAITTSFLNQSVLSIIQTIAGDYGITATGASGETVKQFVISRDEFAADAIVRLLTNYAMIITSDKDGNIVVSEPGTFETSELAFAEGVNLKSAVGMFAGNKRFSRVEAIGQNFLTPGFTGTAQGDSTTTRLKRVFLADEVNQSDCQAAATRIRDYTNGDACRVECELTTLDYIPSGTLVSFESDTIGINAEMLIETVSLEFESDNASAKYTLVSPEKYGGRMVEARYLA